MFDFELFFGRFHPLIVHLPIGFLLLAILFKGLDLRTRSFTYRPALKVTLLLSAVIGVLTCVTGLMLSWSGTYPSDELFFHKWSGVLLAVVTIAWYFIEFKWEVRSIIRHITMGLTVALLVITGHRGGVLTHGSTYLWEGLPVAWQQFLGHDPYEAKKLEFEISSLDSALVYEDIVAPILEARCYSCHSDRKQKSGLRLDSPELMRIGGESGDPLIKSDLEKSKLYHVLSLPLEDDEHMPPKGKTQLTKYEVGVIGSWLAHGGESNKMVSDYRDQKALDQWYDDLVSDEKLFSNTLVPEESVSAPNEAAIQSLQEKGVLLQPVGKNSNYLALSFINVPDLGSTLIHEATTLKEQIIWVDVSGKNLTDQHMSHLASFTRTTDLNLANSTLPDQGLKKLSALKNVQILNLTGTDLEDASLEDLVEWPALRKIFIFQSGVNKEVTKLLQESRPDLLIDTGGYILPAVARDTMEFRYSK